MSESVSGVLAAAEPSPTNASATHGFEPRRLSLPLRIGELTLARFVCQVLVHNEPLIACIAQQPWQLASGEQHDRRVAGYQVKGSWAPDQQIRLRVQGQWIQYVYSVYPRYYLDLSAGYDEYKSKFSSKSLYNLRRQRRLFFEAIKVPTAIVAARTPEEVQAFYRRAREVSSGTYQERLLQAGLPEHEEFQRQMMALAAAGRVRGYLLPGADGRDAAYMYCIVQGKDVVCKYIGYDPSLAKMSPGSTLLLMAIEDLFAEGVFTYFDFEEGGAQYKKQFSTASAPCGNVLLLRSSPWNLVGMCAHRFAGVASAFLSRSLERLGLKAALRKLLRQRAASAST